MRMGLTLAATAIMIASCTQENVMIDSSPVANHQVSISFFEQSIEDIGKTTSDESSLAPALLSSTANSRATTRADKTQSIKACKKFSELVVSLFPKDEGKTETYVVRQDSLDDDFGHVSLDVPAGNYHMVAIASATVMPITTPISIVSASEAHFAAELKDMVYVSQDITVRSDQSSQTVSAGMQRAVSAFELRANEKTPVNAASVDIKITGNCGLVFNPSTGYCKEKAVVSRHIEFDGVKVQYYILKFDVYAFLGEDDVSDLQVDAVMKDKQGQVMKSLHFDNVHLEKGRLTRYTGNIFTKDNYLDFVITNSNMSDSEYSKDF